MSWNARKQPRHNIRLTGRRWRVLVEGDERAVSYGPDERKTIDYLAGRLLAGEDVAPEALEYYGITVRYLGENVEIIEVPVLGDASEWQQNFPTVLAKQVDPDTPLPEQGRLADDDHDA